MSDEPTLSELCGAPESGEKEAVTLRHERAKSKELRGEVQALAEAVVAERLRCAKLILDSYHGSVALGRDDATRVTGYLLNAIVGKRVASAECAVPTAHEVETAVREMCSA